MFDGGSCIARSAALYKNDWKLLVEIKYVCIILMCILTPVLTAKNNSNTIHIFTVDLLILKLIVENEQQS